MEGADDENYRLVSVFSPRQKREYYVLCAIWLAAMLYFWIWWFDPTHVIGLTGFALVTAILVWVTFVPLYFLVVVSGARRPAGSLCLPEDVRVAMIVTKAPSESFDVVKETLGAMLRQDYRHDTWLADEDPSTETLAWCAARGVKVSTRCGRAEYHRMTWPRRTRCKEGNLAFFYDNYGYANYDFVAQFDADHVPTASYLREILKPFADPGVGYVSAPSICDSNAGASWSARGRLIVEATLHGLLQAGYNGGWAPLCIGSHYAVRTAALKQIGGLGPELAEDHSTTLMMNAEGWRGVHALDAIAHGEGPRTFVDLVTQEFQWSRSLVTIFFQYSPRYLPRLPQRLKFQFVFSQLWYPLFSLFMAAMFAMPVVALVGGINFVNVSFPLFLLHIAPVSVAMLTISYRLRDTLSNRPFDAKVLSWEGTLFLLARWPWSLMGTLAALKDRLTGSFVDFRITPKGRDIAAPLPFRAIAPYAVISFGSALPALVIDNVDAARGFYIFAIYTSFLYSILTLAIFTAHIRETGIFSVWQPRTIIGLAILATSLLLPPAAGTAIRATDGLEALAWGAGRVAFTQVTYGVAGAGQGRAGMRRVAFTVKWLDAASNEDSK